MATVDCDFVGQPQAREALQPAKNKAKKISEFSEGGHWISTILDVLHLEPLLAIEPATKLGIQGSISGVVDNFQLNMLLMDQFPQKGLFKRARMSPAAADVAHGIGDQEIDETITAPWDLCTFKAIEPNGSLNSDTTFWIWNEGTPADIPIFRGHRVVLIGPPTYPRSWGAQRMFSDLMANLTVKKELSKSEVQSLLNQMSEA